MIFKLKHSEPEQYDSVCAIVVRASNEKEARRVSQEWAKKTGLGRSQIKDWLDPKKVSCEVVHQEGKSEAIVAEIWDG